MAGPGKPGPPRHSAEVIRLHGNRAKLSKAELEEREAAEVKAEPVRDVDPPKDLSPHARDCWRLHAPELERLGLLTRLDVGSFRLACECYAMAISSLEAMRYKRSDGENDGRRRGYEVVVKDNAHGGMLKKHPAFSTFNMAVNTYRAWCSDFGLTPSARVSLRPGAAAGAGQGAERDDDDGFDFGT